MKGGKGQTSYFLNTPLNDEITMSVYVDFDVKYPPLVSDLKQT